jgi:hypothetical protein
MRRPRPRHSPAPSTPPGAGGNAHAADLARTGGQQR